MTNQKKFSYTVIASLLGGGLLASSPVLAASDMAPAGYWEGSGSVLRSGAGECVHTIEWKPGLAIEQCEPAIVAARDKAKEMAAIEPAAAPPPKMVTQRVDLQADTLFDFDKAQLTPEGKEKLDQMAQQMKGKQGLSIMISGHTDRIGPEAYNLKLSQKRAQAVRDYLVEQGIPGSVVETAALGESQPKATCEGMRGPSLVECLKPNRRTEIEFSAFEVVPAQENK